MRKFPAWTFEDGRWRRGDVAEVRPNGTNWLADLKLSGYDDAGFSWADVQWFASAKHAKAWIDGKLAEALSG